MVHRSSVEKRQAWQARLARYRLSGLSVARFCSEERVSENSFYYWTRRLKNASPADPTPPPACRVGMTARELSGPRGSGQGAAVRFSWSRGVEVWVPAECLEAIRCLAECLASAASQRGEGFQEVVVK